MRLLVHCWEQLTALSTITLDVEASKSIGEIKAMINDKKGIRPDQQRLFLDLDDEWPLEDGHTLSHYNIEDGDLVEMLNIVPVSLRLMSGKTITLDCEVSETIGQLQLRICILLGLPPWRQQRLIFNSEQLEGRRTLSDYNIQKESTLLLVIFVKRCED